MEGGGNISEIIRFEGISYTDDGKDILENISFQIIKGVYNVVVGKNGIGKSTIIKLIAGLYKARNGDIYINGKRMSYASEELYKIRKKVSIVFSGSDEAIAGSTVIDNMIFCMENNRLSCEEMKSNIEKYVRIFKAEDIVHRKISELTGGERQKAVILGAVSISPDVVVLDECMSMMDRDMKKEIIEVLGMLVKEGMTVVSVSHDMHEIRSSTNMVFLKSRNEALSGRTEDILPLYEGQFLDLAEKKVYNNRMKMYYMSKKGGDINLEEGSNWKKEIFNAEMENSPEKQKIRIKLENLGYSYGKRGKKVFCSLNGVIFQGEITLIAGRSGTGKSTLLELIAGIVPSKEINDSLSGEVAYYGFSYGKRGSPMEEGRILLTKEIGEKELKSLRNRTAILFQNVERQLFAMTVKEEIEYNIMKRYGIKDRNSEELNSRTGDVVRMFGFTEEFLMKSPFRLSSGEKKLLGIALAVCRDSEILILDEVVASLDYSNTIRIMGIIRNVAEKGTAVIISSSDTGTISGYVDSILQLEGGHDEVSEDNKNGYYRENHADQGRGNSISLSANENARFHNLDPRIRIVSSMLLLILVILTSFYRKEDFICYYSVILAFLVCQALLSGVSIIKLAKRIRVYVYTTAVLTFFNFFFMQSGRLLVNSRLLKIYDTPLLFSLNAGYQIVLIALVSEILIETTGPDKIIKGIGYLMGRKGKSSAVGLMFTFSLSFLPLIREEGKRIFIAQKSRGAEFRRMSVESMREILMLIIPLFRLSFERVMKIYETMAVKNFIPDGEITEYRPLKLGSRDYIHSFMMISFSILYLIWLFVF